MADTHRYAAFISYSHADGKVAAWLQRALETYRVPSRLVVSAGSARRVPRRLGKVFRDREELASAADLGAEIRTALASSAALIVVCSPDAARSPWVNEEVRTYKSLAGESGVHCVIAAGEPEAGSAEDCFPPALRFKLDEKGRIGSEPAEPLAADLRKGGDGREAAKLKLVAGLLGLGLVDLRQRDQQRRYRRMSAIAAGAMCLVLITSMLAWTAYLARIEAEQQRELAEQETAVVQATMDFMIGLFSTSSPFQRSRAESPDDTAREILDRGAARIDEELKSQPHVQANLRAAIGEVYRGLALYEPAGEQLQAALQTYLELFGEHDARVARVLEELAVVNQGLRNLDEAEAQLDRALQIWRAPATNSALDEAMALNRLAAVVSMQDRLDESVALQRRSVSLLESLPEPTVEYLVLVYHQLGYVLQIADDMEGAGTAYRKALALMQDIEAPGQEIQTRSNLATVYMSTGRLDEARALHEETLALKRDWFGEHHPEVAYSLNNLAWVAHEVGDLERAIPFYQRSIELFIETLGEDHPNISVVRGNLSEALAGTGRHELAIATSRKAVAGIEASAGPDSLALLSILVGYGRVCLEVGDPDCALEQLTRAVEIGRNIAADSRGTAMALAEYAALDNAPLTDSERDAMFDTSLEILLDRRGPRHSDRAEVLMRSARHLKATERAAEGRAEFIEALDILAESIGESSRRYAEDLAAFQQLFGSATGDRPDDT